MSSTRAKRARRPGAAGRVLARAASAVPKSGHGPSSAVTRSMSAGVFPPTSSRSTRPRTSTRAPEFAGYGGLHEAVPQRIGPGISVTAAGPAGSHRWFPEGSGDQGFVPRSQQSPDGRPDRPGASGAFACPGSSLSPPGLPLLSPSPPVVSPEPTPYVSPEPTLD